MGGCQCAYNREHRGCNADIEGCQRTDRGGLQYIVTLIVTKYITFTITVTVTVLELLHGPFLSPQISQIQFFPISRDGINWSVCRSNSLRTLHSTHWQVHSSSRNWRKFYLKCLRRMNWTTAALHCIVLHSTILYCTTL